MTDLIRPEDITKEQAEHFAELMDADFGRFLHDYQAIPINKIANAMIEAGIVSPPVYCERYRDGRLKKTPFGHMLVFTEGKEHWKGQTE